MRGKVDPHVEHSMVEGRQGIPCRREYIDIFQNGVSLVADNRHSMEEGGKQLHQLYGSTLTISKVEKGAAYTCVAINVLGERRHTTHVIVDCEYY